MIVERLETIELKLLVLEGESFDRVQVVVTVLKETRGLEVSPETLQSRPHFLEVLARLSTDPGNAQCWMAR